MQHQSYQAGNTSQILPSYLLQQAGSIPNVQTLDSKKSSIKASDSLAKHNEFSEKYINKKFLPYLKVQNMNLFKADIQHSLKGIQKTEPDSIAYDRG
jgi:hypothetical protein